MQLHPLASGFGEVAEIYERGRPEYPAAAVGAAVAQLGLVAGATVLDLAAGTGKLTRGLLTLGLDVIAVEPQQTLREVLERCAPMARALDGRAEQIPLEDSSVAAVTVGEAFHWFDHGPALAEIRRVLRPSGGLASFTVVPDWHGASWAHEVGTLIHGARPAHPHFNRPPWQDLVRADPRFSDLREIRITTAQATDPARVLDYIASMSWVASAPQQQRLELLARAGELISCGHTPSELPLHVSISITRLL